MIEPSSMDGLAYFTRRVIGNGRVVAWVSMKLCPKCGKSFMGKPLGKDGKAMIRAKNYSCKSCGYTADKNEYEETLTCQIKYTCPECLKEGEVEIPFKRKKYNGTDALVFKCSHCNKDIAISKKMKPQKAQKSSEIFGSQEPQGSCGS